MPKSLSLFPDEDDYSQFLRDLKTRIRQAQIKAALAVNREIVLLYWSIGRDILAKQQAQGWGSKVIDRLAKDLKREFPDIKGFSPRNLKYMRTFAEAYPDKPIVQEVLAQIPWYHNIALLEKLKDLERRLWYACQTVENGWSRNVLVLQIESGLYRHTDDQPTIGIVLCKSKSKTIAEYALRNVNTPIAVSTHKLPHTLQDSLPTVGQLEMELDAAVTEFKQRDET